MHGARVRVCVAFAMGPGCTYLIMFKTQVSRGGVSRLRSLKKHVFVSVAHNQSFEEGKYTFRRVGDGVDRIMAMLFPL